MPPNRIKNDWADAVQRIAVRAISSGYTITLAVTFIIVALIWKIDSRDLKEVLLAFLNNPILNGLGWLLFFLMIWICKFLLTRVDNMYAAQISAYKEEIKELKEPSSGPENPPLLPQKNKE